MVHFAICPHCQTMAFGTEDFHNTCWVCPHCNKWVQPEDTQDTMEVRMIRNLNANTDGRLRYE